jgi:[ribosomal protein S5]-alanine N-acetyltransferase
MQPTFDFGEFPELKAARVDLCEYDEKFTEDIFVFRGDAEVQLYNSAPRRTLDETLEFIREELELYRRKEEVIWAVTLRASRRVIGSVSVQHWDRYHHRAEIGYELARDCWGQGLAQEAIREVLRFAFERMDLSRIQIHTSTANLRSLRLAERLGFTREGTLRKHILEDDGQFHDGAVFGLLRSEWLADERHSGSCGAMSRPKPADRTVR